LKPYVNLGVPKPQQELQLIYGEKIQMIFCICNRSEKNKTIRISIRQLENMRTFFTNISPHPQIYFFSRQNFPEGYIDFLTFIGEKSRKLGSLEW
jgi:hypothetical protein